MTELPVYQFLPDRHRDCCSGLSAARLLAVGAAGVVLIATLTRPTPTSLLSGVATIVALAAAVVMKVGGRAAIDWLPIWIAFGWQQATRKTSSTPAPTSRSTCPTACPPTLRTNWAPAGSI